MTVCGAAISILLGFPWEDLEARALGLCLPKLTSHAWRDREPALQEDLQEWLPTVSDVCVRLKMENKAAALHHPLRRGPDRSREGEERRTQQCCTLSCEKTAHTHLTPLHAVNYGRDDAVHQSSQIQQLNAMTAHSCSQV